MPLDYTRRVVTLALLPLCLLLSLLQGCDQEEAGDTSATQPTTNEVTMTAPQKKAFQEALQSETDSLLFLEKQRAAFVADGTPPPVESLNMAPSTAPSPMMRSAQDRYSFDSPPAPPVSRPDQLLNLPATSTPRFTVKDRDWPQTVGDMSVALWSQDKLAAFSLTIDDNHVHNHNFWYDMEDQYGWKWTWFLIANQVGWSHNDHWGHWQKALDRGHDIQSHTYSHLCDALFYTSREYRQAQATINQNLKGAKVLTVAYPFGISSNKIGSPCAPLSTDRTKNSRDEAAKHYLAARDVFGALTSPAKIDYMKVPSISAARNFFNSNAPWAYFDSIFDPNSRNWRTWYSVHYHGLYNDTAKEDVRKVLAHLKVHEDKVWVGTFTAIAKYAQQQATARLEDIQLDQSSIRFTLKDMMNDVWFDEPLTVKIRLPDTQNGALRAQQQGAALPAKLIQYQGKPYALVDAIPDRGEVIVDF